MRQALVEYHDGGVRHDGPSSISLAISTRVQTVQLHLLEEINYVAVLSAGHRLYHAVNRSIATPSPFVGGGAQIWKKLNRYWLRHSLPPQLNHLAKAALFNRIVRFNFSNTDQKRQQPIGNYALLKSDCF